jgi:hypothetical protein
MKLIKTLCLITFFIVTIGTIQADARRDRDDKQSTGDTWDYWVCPWCGSQNYEDGDRNPLWYHNYWEKRMMGKESKSHELEKPITIDQAKSVLERYIIFSGNPNIRLGKITEQDKYFEAEIITKDGSLVDTLIIDKETGGIESIY